jgi:hypothetical protein
MHAADRVLDRQRIGRDYHLNVRRRRCRVSHGGRHVVDAEILETARDRLGGDFLALAASAPLRCRIRGD